jgi:hypothetical protein
MRTIRRPDAAVVREQAIRVLRKMRDGWSLTPSERCRGLGGDLGFDGSGKKIQPVSMAVMNLLVCEGWVFRKPPYFDEFFLTDAGREASA